MDAEGSKKPSVHDRLVEAGLRLFRRFGLRRTTMEAIAQEAQVSKATAYAVFPNKTAVFTAVVEQVIGRLVDDAIAVAELEQGPQAAIERSMERKFGQLYEVVHQSLAGAELLQASNTLTAEVVAKGHAAYVNHLTKLLVACGVEERKRARELAEVLDAAGEGVVARATSKDDAERRIRLLVDRFVTR